MSERKSNSDCAAAAANNKSDRPVEVFTKAETNYYSCVCKAWTRLGIGMSAFL